MSHRRLAGAGLRAAVLASVVLASACTTFPIQPSRPAPSPAPTPAAPPPPVSQPLPAPPSARLPPLGSESRSVTTPTTGTVVPPRPQSDATTASTALVQQSRAQRAAGSLPAAKASLERALRLDPNNPEIWLELGEIELTTGNTAQAATMARKALSLTGRDPGLRARAERLLRASE